MLCLRCWVGFSLDAVSRGYSVVVLCGLPMVGSLAWSTGSRARGLQYLWYMVSIAVVFGLNSCGTLA